jgi:hypothetical protein
MRKLLEVGREVAEEGDDLIQSVWPLLDRSWRSASQRLVALPDPSVGRRPGGGQRCYDLDGAQTLNYRCAGHRV